ncbi:MAG TPA: hypothetical protein VEF04_22840, partial [Blastocatellia bacterium]|nr:hypothetical protein [Blastocatellia bacterium]
MQFPGRGKPPLAIIYDSAFGHRADDPLALALLYHLDGKNEARLIAQSISTADLKAAASLAAISRFYRAMPERDPMPIGMFVSAKLKNEATMTTALLSKHDAEGKPIYKHAIERWQDTADPLPLMRNALASQPDQNVIVIVTGPATNAARLLNHPGAKELIARKAKLLVIAAGDFSNSSPDPLLETDIPSAQKLFAEWPTEIVAVGQEVGKGILFPAASIEKDFTWSNAHPIADAYRAYQPMPYDAPTSAMAAVLYAIRQQGNYFKLSDTGTIQVLDDGQTKFSPRADSKHRYLILDEAKKDQVLAAYIEMASAKPIPPPTRIRQPIVQQQAA